MPTGVPDLVKRLILFGASALALLLIVGVASNAEQFAQGELGSGAPRDILPIEADLAVGVEETPRVEEPIELPDWVAVAIAIVLGIGLLYLLSRQRFSLRFRRPSIQIARSAADEITEEEEAEAIADFARDLIHELNEGDSPRYAIPRA